MAVSQISIISSARVNAGEEPISTLGSPDAMTRAALAVYEDLVLNEIETGEWVFSERQSAPAIASTDTNRDLSYQYLIPSDSLGIVGVRYQDQPLEGSLFRIEGSYVWTAFNAGVTFLDKFRPDESLWSRRFANIISEKLTAVFMRSTERHSEARGAMQNAARMSLIARHAESRQRHNRPMGDGSIINRRRGGGIYPMTNLPGLGSGFSTPLTPPDLSLEDDDIYVSADYTVEPGKGYVGVDCTAGGGVTIRITYVPGNTTLRKSCEFQKVDSSRNPSALGTMEIYDGTQVVWDQQPADPIVFRRAGTRLAGPR